MASFSQDKSQTQSDLQVYLTSLLPAALFPTLDAHTTLSLTFPEHPIISSNCVSVSAVCL